MRSKDAGKGGKASKGKQRDRRKAVAPGPGDPEVLLDVECARGCLYLVLVNVGPVTAFEVAVDFHEPLLGAGGDVDVAGFRIFRRLPLLRAGKEIRVFLDLARDFLARRQTKLVKARVRYETRDGKYLGESFVHDLGIWRDFGEVLFEGGTAIRGPDVVGPSRVGIRRDTRLG